MDETTRTETGDPVHRTVVEEVAQLLGYNPNDVVEIVVTPMRLHVIEVERTDTTRTLVTHIHVIT